MTGIKPKQRGGHREGAGRRHIPPDERRVQSTMYLAADLEAFVERECGSSDRKAKNRWIEAQLRKLYIESRII